MQETLTFDDVLLVPQYSEIRPKEAVLESKLTRNIPLRLPLVSASMDTVTEHRLAIALALAGGIGIIHKNLTIDQQAREVRLVKRFENGFITEPVTIGPEDTIQAVYDIRIKKGYKSAPVVDKEGKLLGLITKLDYFWPHDKDKLVREMMVPARELETASSDISLEQANDIIYTKKLGVLCLVDAAGRLSAIVTRKDLEKNEMYPRANKDINKSLRVGAAVSVGEAALERARLLVASGVNVIVVDVAHGHSRGVIDTVKMLKSDAITKEIDVIFVLTDELKKEKVKFFIHDIIYSLATLYTDQSLIKICTYFPLYPPRLSLPSFTTSGHLSTIPKIYIIQITNRAKLILNIFLNT
ncbi:MAG: IMP dehydrogenase, partial [Patescibacteria group bacterium]